MAGYASHPLDPKWPHKAKVGLNFVINYEEGGENCLLHSDGENEKLLSDIVTDLVCACPIQKRNVMVCD